MGRIIGIDLGTTNSLAAVWEDGRSVLIPNAWGEFLTPSAVSIDKKRTVYVGRIAKERKMTHPDATVTSFKRHMGTGYRYEIHGWKYRPEELSALVLKQLKEDAENYLGQPVEEAVISVPAYFNDKARKAVKAAGALAGLKVERIINEPSAAALACQNRNMQEDVNIMVFDFGGGTLDVSIVECFENIIEITSISGDNRLGGDDFDLVIAKEFCSRNGLEFDALKEGQRAELLAAADRCKRRLTDGEEARMAVAVDGAEKTMLLTRKELIRIARVLFLRMENPIRRALSDRRHGAEELHQIVMVGGSCKMPVVQYFMRHLMEKCPIRVEEPDHMVALGMGVYAGIKERREEVRDMLLTDVCPFSLGTAIYNEGNPGMDIMHIMIERNTALPVSREDTFYPVTERQTNVVFAIYQGEEFYAENNLKLGTMKIKLPPAPGKQRSITVRYTYDINGILVIDARVDYTGKTFQKVIVDSDTDMSQSQIDDHIKKLERLKVHPRDKEENQFLLTRGDRLYQAASGYLRDDIAGKLKYFDHLLGRQEELLLARWRKAFAAYLDEAEEIMGVAGMNMNDAGSFAAWYEENVENKQEEDEKEAWAFYDVWNGKRTLH